MILTVLCKDTLCNDGDHAVQASSCLLSSADTLDYNQLYSACVKLLMAGSRCDLTKQKLSPLVRFSSHTL